MHNSSDEQKRFPVAVGTHYPVSREQIIAFLDETVKSTLTRNFSKVRGAILPSIEYSESLPLLLSAYIPIAKQGVDEIFLFADSVLHDFNGVALHPARLWESPMGDLELSHRARKLVGSDDKAEDLIRFDETAHLGEVAIEIQLPIISHMWDRGIRILPFSVGKASPRVIADLLRTEIAQDDLIIVPTTLATVVPADLCRELDAKSISRIMELDVEYFEKSEAVASSHNSIAILLQFARDNSLRPELLGSKIIDIGGDGLRVTGILSVLFVE